MNHQHKNKTIRSIWEHNHIFEKHVKYAEDNVLKSEKHAKDAEKMFSVPN